MKSVLLFFGLVGSVNLGAQNYVLLDKHFAQPITYTNTVTSANKFDGFFPVERKILPQFINALEEIENELSSKLPFGETKQYEFGCTKFVGTTVSHASEIRMDYLLTSICDNVNVSLHLCDSKMSNAGNLFFIKTLINYIQSYLK